MLEKSTQLKINKSSTELSRPEGDQSTKWAKGLAVGRLRTKRILEMSKGIRQLPHSPFCIQKACSWQFPI